MIVTISSTDRIGTLDWFFPFAVRFLHLFFFFFFCKFRLIFFLLLFFWLNALKPHTDRQQSTTTINHGWKWLPFLNWSMRTVLRQPAQEPQKLQVATSIDCSFFGFLIAFAFLSLSLSTVDIKFFFRSCRNVVIPMLFFFSIYHQRHCMYTQERKSERE